MQQPVRGFPGPPPPQAPGWAPPAWQAPQPGTSLPYPPVRPYQDASGLTKTLVVLVLSLLVAQAVSLVVSFLQAQALAESFPPDDGAFVGWGIASGMIGMVAGGLWLACAIVFGFWMARTYQNAVALTGPLRQSAAWTVGAWYIPVVGPFLALGPLARVWERGPGGPKGIPMAWATLFGVYQVAALVGFVLVFSAMMGAFRQGLAGDADAAAGLYAWDGIHGIMQLVSYGIYVAAGILMVVAMRAMQASHTHRAAALPRPPMPRPVW